MAEIYECQFCGKQSSDENEFQTDLDNVQDKDDMTCEECYDNFDK